MPLGPRILPSKSTSAIAFAVVGVIVVAASLPIEYVAERLRIVNTVPSPPCATVAVDNVLSATAEQESRLDTARFIARCHTKSKPIAL
jgi:hypothetical protein